MLRFVVQSFTEAKWRALTGGAAGLSLIQTWAYGAAKAETGPWHVERGVFVGAGANGGETVVGAAQALIRRAPLIPGGLVWINRAPLALGPAEEATRTAMLDALRRHYVTCNGYYLRVAPAETESGRDAAVADEGGFRSAGFAGWASAVLDLAPEPEALRQGLHQKWRNCLNKAERQDLAVVEATDGVAFARYLDGHRRQAESTGFAGTVTADFLATLQRHLPASQKLRALVASDAAGEAIAGALVATYGATAEYLAAFATDAGRKANAGQLLLWRAIADARERGCRRFDLGGMDPDLTPAGIYRFKEQVGGTPYRLAAEIEASPGGAVAALVRRRTNAARAAGAGAA